MKNDVIIVSNFTKNRHKLNRQQTRQPPKAAETCIFSVQKKALSPIFRPTDSVEDKRGDITDSTDGIFVLYRGERTDSSKIVFFREDEIPKIKTVRLCFNRYVLYFFQL